MAAAQVLLVGQAAQLFVFEHAFQLFHFGLQIFISGRGFGRFKHLCRFGGAFCMGLLVLFGHGSYPVVGK